MEKMRSEILKITPEMAKAFLERNMKNNRRVNHDTVKRYARIMKGGGWNLTHQGIAFDENGELIDGQHRLQAIIIANVPVTMMVTYGVPHTDGEAFTIDAGRKRTVQNIMQISGIDDPVYKFVCPYVTSYIKWKIPGQRVAEAAEIISYIDRHYEECTQLFILTRRDNGTRKIPTQVGAGLLAALYRGESHDALMRFVDVYRRNDVAGCENYNPRHALNLRDYVRDHRDSAEMYTRIESAIFAFCNNRPKLTVRDNCYPYNSALDA